MFFPLQGVVSIITVLACLATFDSTIPRLFGFDTSDAHKYQVPVVFSFLLIGVAAYIYVTSTQLLSLTLDGTVGSSSEAATRKIHLLRILAVLINFVGLVLLANSK